MLCNEHVSKHNIFCALRALIQPLRMRKYVGAEHLTSDCVLTNVFSEDALIGKLHDLNAFVLYL